MQRLAGAIALLIGIGASPARSQVAARSSGIVANAPAARPLLDQLVGIWRMTGQVRGRPATYALDARRVLGGRFVELHMTDAAKPPAYEARVFIGEDTTAGKVLVHWMDSFGAAFSVPAAAGAIEGDTVRFQFAYSSGPFRDTFVYHRATGTWTFVLESGDAAGTWKPFAEYVVTHPAARGHVAP